MVPLLGSKGRLDNYCLDMSVNNHVPWHLQQRSQYQHNHSAWEVLPDINSTLREEVLKVGWPNNPTHHDKVYEAN